MSTPTNHWKLGLFVVMGVIACVATVLFFGGRSLKTETVPYRTYFDESVQGLEVGSPVKFRGVTIGSVSDIALAGDKRHVEVTYTLGEKVLSSLGLTVERSNGTYTKLVIPPDLRVQLASSGITGVKFMQMDFFEVKANPPLVLPFSVPENYISAVPSMMKNLEDSVVQAVDRFPELAKQLLVVLTQVSNMFVQLEGARLPEKAAQTLALLNKVLEQVSTALVELEPGALSSEARQALKKVSAAVTTLNEIMEQVGGERGLVASLHRTSETLGGMAQNANQVGPAVEETLKDVRGAALSVGRFADALELDPDMLVKGRATRVSK
ncbi:MAG: MlaD family protein [Myxococcaceae bacterium]